MVSNMGVGRNTAPQRVLGFEVTGKQFILDARMLGELTQARRLETNGGKNVKCAGEDARTFVPLGLLLLRSS
jgi:hypothetical protein